MLETDAIFITYIWQTTFVFVALSLVIFSILVIKRFFYDRKKLKDLERHEKIEKYLLIHLSTPLRHIKSLLIKNNRDYEHVAEVAPNILRTLKGRSYDSTLETLENIGLYKWALKSLNKAGDQQKIIAINILAFWPNKRVKSRIKALLKVSNMIVCYTAVEMLAATKDKKLFSTIIKTFKRNNFFSTPLMSDILQSFGNDILEDLVSITTNKTTPLRLINAALIALGQSNEPNYIMQAAIPLCSHRDKKVRTAAFFALAQVNDEIADDILNIGLNDAHWEVRRFTAQCCLSNRNFPADILSSLLNDENWFVGLKAGEALFDYGETGRKLLVILSQRTNRAGTRAKMILAEKSF